MLSDDYKAWDECPDADNSELIYEFCKLTRKFDSLASLVS